MRFAQWIITSILDFKNQNSILNLWGIGLGVRWILIRAWEMLRCKRNIYIVVLTCINILLSSSLFCQTFSSIAPLYKQNFLCMASPYRWELDFCCLFSCMFSIDTLKKYIIQFTMTIQAKKKILNLS